MPTRVRRIAATKPLEPSAIFGEIESHPPLMREQARAAYIGREVAWSAIFVNGYEQSPGQVRLTFQPEPNEIKFISVTTRLSDYPWLKSACAGEAVRLRGNIRSIDTLSVEVDLKELVPAKPSGHT